MYLQKKMYNILAFKQVCRKQQSFTKNGWLNSKTVGVQIIQKDWEVGLRNIKNSGKNTGVG